MTQTDSDRIMELCRLICEEHDPGMFQKLVTELNQLLVRKEDTWRSRRTRRTPPYDQRSLRLTTVR